MCCVAPLNQVFVAFALFGKGHAGADLRAERVRMDGKAFAKLIKESGCMGRGLDATRVDLCFAKACDKVRACSTLDTKQITANTSACAYATTRHDVRTVGPRAGHEAHELRTV